MAGSKGGKGGGAVQSVFGPRGGAGGGIFDRLRQQFPQFMPQQQPQFTPFGQQPVGETFAPQPQVQPFGQPPVGETFAPQPQAQPFAGPQPVLQPQPPQQGPPGVTQLGPEAIISEGFGLPQPQRQGPVQRFEGPMVNQFSPTRPAPEALLQSPRSPLGPLVDPRGRRKDFAF